MQMFLMHIATCMRALLNYEMYFQTPIDSIASVKKLFSLIVYQILELILKINVLKHFPRPGFYVLKLTPKIVYSCEYGAYHKKAVT